MPIAALFDGENAPFIAPLVGNEKVSSGGFFSYVPLPFARSLRITGTSGSSYFYNFDFHSLPPDTGVTSWTGAEDLRPRDGLGSVGRQCKPLGTSATVVGPFDLAPGASQVLFDRDGPSELTSIEMKLPSVARTLDAAAERPTGPAGDADVPTSSSPIRSTRFWITIQWDGESVGERRRAHRCVLRPRQPAAHGQRRTDGRRAQRRDALLYFPMPFARHGTSSSSIAARRPFRGASVRIGSRPFPYPFDTVGTFAVQYTEGPERRRGRSDAPRDVRQRQDRGRRRLPRLARPAPSAGAPLSRRRRARPGRRGSHAGRPWGPGPRTSSTAASTSTGDPSAYPSHGNVAHDAASAVDATSAYRFFLSDPIAFRDYVRFSLQHGPADDVDVQAATLVYYYRQPRARLVQSDAFVVGDAAGEAAHQYRLTNATWSGSFTGTFEGELDAQSSTSTGRAHRGSSFFVVQVDPRETRASSCDGSRPGDRRPARAGAGRRRRGRLAHARQQRLAPVARGRLRLPASVTAGKSSLSIEIRFVSSDDDWNEFQYVALSQMP